MAAKMATIVGDVTGLQQRHHPESMPHLVKNIKGFPLKVKSFQNTAIYQKLRGGVPSTFPPPPCTTVGVRIRLYVQGLICLFKECCTDPLVYSLIRNGKPTLSTPSTPKNKKKSYKVLVGAKKNHARYTLRKKIHGE